MAIHGVGTDIVSIKRIGDALGRHEGRFARKILADSEWAAFSALKDGTAYAAKRFAAKEAFFKALGEPPSSANTWHELAIENDADGRPRLVYGKLLAALMHEKAIVAGHISLSDEREHAVAFVVLEKGA